MTKQLSAIFDVAKYHKQYLVLLENTQSPCGLRFWSNSQAYENKLSLFLESLSDTELNIDAVEKILIECVNLACEGNNSRPLASFRVKRSPLSNFLNQLRVDIIKAINQNDSALSEQLIIKGAEYFKLAKETYEAAIQFKKEHQEARVNTLVGGLKDGIATTTTEINQHRDHNPIIVPALATQVRYSKNMVNQTIQTEREGKQHYQDSLVEYDNLIRKAAALGHEGALQKAAYYGLMDSVEFKPNGTWWNLR